MNVFVEIGAILAITAIVSFIVRFLKQPLIVGYIVTGIIVGPYVLNIFHSHEELELFSKIGITMLLFIVGLHLSPRVVKDLGKVSLATGIAQIVLTTIVGLGIALFLGIPKIAALYTSIALTFSSTIIIIKLLSDKRDLSKLYGQMAVGLLLIQDIVATVILIFISTLQSSTGANPYIEIAMALMKGFVLIALLLLISAYVLPRLFKAISNSQELMFIVSLAWGIGLAAAFQVVGFSVEIGALVAGVALASTPYSHEIGSRMKPLRDFFILLFFVLLGATLVVDNIAAIILPTLILSLFVLVGNPLIMMVIMNLLGFTRRTSFQSGIVVAQISEFSLILAAIGLRIGHLSKDVVSIITLVGLITIGLSTYLIMHSDRIYKIVEPYLGLIELRKRPRRKDKNTKEYQLALFGYDRVGKDFVNAFKELGKKYIVIDFNPSSIQQLEEQEIPYIYGDADDAEFLEDLNLQDITLAVSTIPDQHTNLLIIEKLLQVNPKAIIITLAQNAKQAHELYDKGATYVIVPHYLGARYATRMILKHEFKRSDYAEERGKHLDYLMKNYKPVTPPAEEGTS